MPLVSHPTFWVDFPITGASTDAMICEPGITMVQVPCTWSATQGIKRNVSAIGNVATMNSITDDLPSDLSWKTPPTDKCRAILTVLRDMESAKRPAKLRDAQIPGLDISSSTLNVGAGAIVQSADRYHFLMIWNHPLLGQNYRDWGLFMRPSGNEGIPPASIELLDKPVPTEEDIAQYGVLTGLPSDSFELELYPGNLETHAALESTRQPSCEIPFDHFSATIQSAVAHLNQAEQYRARMMTLLRDAGTWYSKCGDAFDDIGEHIGRLEKSLDRFGLSTEDLNAATKVSSWTSPYVSTANRVKQSGLENHAEHPLSDWAPRHDKKRVNHDGSQEQLAALRELHTQIRKLRLHHSTLAGDQELIGNAVMSTSKPAARQDFDLREMKVGLVSASSLVEEVEQQARRRAADDGI